jgi:thiamine biosynthesis lipoprotein
MIEPQASRVSDRESAPLRRFAHDAMACTFELWLAEPDACYAAQAAQAAFAEVDRLEAELSRFIPTSDVARINAAGPEQFVRVSIETLECLQLAARLYDETAGAFDVTFGSAPSRPHVPFPIVVDARGYTVRLRRDGVRVDLGGFGKGYAVDQIAATLRDWSIATALIHCGQSTVFALGGPAEEQTWTVALRDPAEHGTTLGRVSICDAALSGSGRKLHGDHIIDPRSAQPVSDKVGAWALASSAVLADALSTAFMVMSSEEVAAYCEKHPDVSGLLCLAGEPGRRRHFGRTFRALSGDECDSV